MNAKWSALLALLLAGCGTLWNPEKPAYSDISLSQVAIETVPAAVVKSFQAKVPDEKPLSISVGKGRGGTVIYRVSSSSAGNYYYFSEDGVWRGTIIRRRRGL